MANLKLKGEHTLTDRVRSLLSVKPMAVHQIATRLDSPGIHSVIHRLLSKSEIEVVGRTQKLHAYDGGGREVEVYGMVDRGETIRD